jgi:hypothetical protein
MRRIGDVYELKDERDAELLRTFRLHLMQEGSISLPECVERTVMSPTTRFWVSKERATCVMQSLLRGEGLGKMSATKREMYCEIFQRLLDARDLHPDWSVSQLTGCVVRQPAPRFYLTPKSAVVILCRIRRERAWRKPRQ